MMYVPVCIINDTIIPQVYVCMLISCHMNACTVVCTSINTTVVVCVMIDDGCDDDG